MSQPRMYGSPVIRVTRRLTSEEREAREASARPFDYGTHVDHYFYDVEEAKRFVDERWTKGEELSARMRDGGRWMPIYLISATGEVFATSEARS